MERWREKGKEESDDCLTRMKNLHNKEAKGQQRGQLETLQKFKSVRVKNNRQKIREKDTGNIVIEKNYIQREWQREFISGRIKLRNSH